MMNFRNYILYFFLVLNLTAGLAQNMDEGFKDLEEGRFARAETFFQNILSEFPENKTARLCYGRALGLHSDPEKAVYLFIELLKDYPGDLEIQLNYAESLLWSKRFAEAELYYAALVKENPENFAALLGYANTLSNLKKYEQASQWVDGALTILPENQNARISQKYIRLGYANALLKTDEYDRAIQLLDKNLQNFVNDKESLLSKANIYLRQKRSEEAIEVYQTLAENKKDGVEALAGISLAYHLVPKEKKALDFAEMAKDLAGTSGDSTLVILANERYIQALIWNGKYRTAEDLIEDLLKINDNEPRYLALAASLGMYTGEFQRSIEIYKRMLQQDSTSFDGNLGIANAYFARGYIHDARKSALKTLSFYENQKDAMQLLGKIEQSFRPMVEENVSYSFDNGNNDAVALTTNFRLPLNTKLEFYGSYTYRKTENNITALEATSNHFSLAAAYRLNPVFKFRINTGLVNARASQTDYTNLTGEIAAQVKPFSRDDLEIGYRRDLQDFNAELLSRKIAGDHLFLSNNYSTRSGLGWYFQYIHTEQSDNNSRDLMFTSVYYSFLKRPVLKGGLNYQYISFKEQMPELYFSPDKFRAAEVFLNLVGNDPDSALSYDLTAATGFQFIEDQEGQSTYRLQGRAGYQLNPDLILGLYGTHSNIASATAAGFTYTEFGVNLKWFLTKKPLFKFN